jgi:hypothetical protein
MEETYRGLPFELPSSWTELVPHDGVATTTYYVLEWQKIKKLRRDLRHRCVCGDLERLKPEDVVTMHAKPPPLPTEAVPATPKAASKLKIAARMKNIAAAALNQDRSEKQRQIDLRVRLSRSVGSWEPGDPLGNGVRKNTFMDLLKTAAKDRRISLASTLDNLY